jgi:hypothetical protein
MLRRCIGPARKIRHGNAALSTSASVGSSFAARKRSTAETFMARKRSRAAKEGSTSVERTPETRLFRNPLDSRDTLRAAASFKAKKSLIEDDPNGAPSEFSDVYSRGHSAAAERKVLPRWMMIRTLLQVYFDS